MLTATEDLCDPALRTDRCLRRVVDRLHLADHLDDAVFDSARTFGPLLLERRHVDDPRLSRFLVFQLAELLGEGIRSAWNELPSDVDETIQDSLENACFPTDGEPLRDPGDWRVDYPERTRPVVMAGLGYASFFARATEPDGAQYVEQVLDDLGRS